MKYINLKNDFKVDRTKDEVPMTDQELTLSWLRHTLVAGYPNMNSDRRRMYVGLSDRMDKAAEDKYDYFAVNPIEYSFMKTAFDNAVSKSEHAVYVTIAENALLNAVDQLPDNTLKA